MGCLESKRSVVFVIFGLRTLLCVDMGGGCGFNEFPDRCRLEPRARVVHSI